MERAKNEQLNIGKFLINSNRHKFVNPQSCYYQLEKESFKKVEEEKWGGVRREGQKSEMNESKWNVKAIIKNFSPYLPLPSSSYTFPPFFFFRPTAYFFDWIRKTHNSWSSNSS